MALARSTEQSDLPQGIFNFSSSNRVLLFDTGFTILAGGSAPPDWSAVEDKKLRDAVEQFGTGGPSQLYFQLCQMNLGSMEPKSEESNFETLHAGVRQLQHNY